ncbi:MAG TPA: ImcF-related family protein [Bryobacteraceae bacterium]|nr:ImcF-related family protein [Bryobacteraceae bacterium]
MVLYIVMGVTVVALIVLTVIYFQRKKKARLAAAAGGEVVAPGGDEISVLIHEAERKLAAAKLEQGGKVGGLPVFLIMGEPGTTKTSVMLHSGLEPELLAGQVYQAGNVAPTRSANFWFSRRAVFAEAGGAMVSDAGKWSRLVKRLQPRKAVIRKGEQAPRAALVCFDCENFTKPGAPDIATNSARTLRARLGEISQAMGINLPVYALFTKTDRLPFFTDYVRNLTNDESTQVLGVTLPMTDRRTEGVYAEEETTRLTGQFERLFRSLADARIEFLAREGDAAKLPPAYEFPREFRKVRPALVQFLVDLCRPSQLTVGPFLRGFYFTGVRPVVVNEMAPVAAAPQQQGFSAPSGATGIFVRGMTSGPAASPAAPPQAIGTRKVPQWLFLAHLFNDILLADRSAMGASGASTRTSSARRWLFIAGASLCFLLIVFFTISYFNNRGLETDVRDAARAIPPGEVTGPDFAPLASLQKLDVLRQSLVTLMGYRKDGSPYLYRWELYVGDDVYKAARPVYCGDLRQLLLKQTQANMLAYLRTLPGSSAEYRPAYEALRSYLITTSHPDKSDSQLAPVLMRFWLNDRAADPDRQALARKQFDFYQQDLLVDSPCASSPDKLTVASAQLYLKSLGSTQRVYLAMLAEADRKFKPINFNRSFPGSEKVVVDPYEVRGAFSKDGWKFMNDAIAHPDRYVKGEAWVLGDAAAENIDLARLSLEIRTLYSDDFVKEWTAYIKGANVLRYGGLKDAAIKLKQHSSPLAPLLELSSQASQNTSVDDPRVAGKFQPVQSVTPPENLDHYVAPSNQAYISALGQLQSAIESVADQQPLNDAAAAQTMQVAKQAEATVGQMANSFHIDSPVFQMLQKLLMDPITNVEGFLKPPPPGADLNAKGAALCKQLAGVLGKYPFNPKGPDATMQEIDSFLKPKEGALWQFVDSNLQKFVTRQGSQYVQTPGGGVNISPAFLGWLNRAAAFTDAAFKEGSADPKLNYSVKPVPSADLDFVKWTVDGQATQFPGDAPSAKPFVWPGSAPDNHFVQLILKFKGGSEIQVNRQEGLWAVFKLVDAADRHLGPDIIELSSRSGGQVNIDVASGHPIKVSVEITATPPIFRPGYFAGLSCVSGVALK